MKKTIVTGLAAALVFGVCATGVLAAGRYGNGGTRGMGVVQAGTAVCTGGVHVCGMDEDADGLCDVCGSSVHCWGDTDGDGFCDTCGAAHTCRRDEDGDGVCDVCGAACGTAGAYGGHGGHGHGAGHGCAG